MARRSRGRAWQREPLVAFLAAGAALFIAYRLLNPVTVEGDAKRIVVTAEDLQQMSVAWLAQGRQPPTAEEMRGLVERWVREEVLFREALELGLDQNDTIVKRRMVQKMEFLAEDLSDLREPTRADLEAFLRAHTSRFVEPPRATFRHLYFSPDRRGGVGARAAAEQARTALAVRPADAPGAAALGDRFMLQDYYPERTPEQIAKDFGPRFARELFACSPAAWQGPIESGLGWHVVWIDALTPERVPDLDEIEDAVRNAWIAERRDEFKRQSYDRMRARYEIVLPDPAIATSSATSSEAGR